MEIDDVVVVDSVGLRELVLVVDCVGLQDPVLVVDGLGDSDAVFVEEEEPLWELVDVVDGV